MQEFDLQRAAEEFGIRKEDGVVLAQRLKDFVELQARGWHYHLQKMDLPKRDGRYAIESKRWDGYLGIVAPKDLPNMGAGQTFLVAWNNDGGSTSGYGKRIDRDPMTIWLAKGSFVEHGRGVTDYLAIKFYDVGQLVHGTEEIKFNITGPLDSAIYIDSPVIITPTITTPTIF